MPIYANDNIENREGVFMSRYTVKIGIFEKTANKPEQRLHMILDGGIPDILVNDVLLRQNFIKKKDIPHRENTGPVFRWCKFANYIWEHYQKTYMNASMDNIYEFLYMLEDLEGCSYLTISGYVAVISKVYEHLAAHNYPIDKSLFRPTEDILITGRKKSRRQNLTYISNLRQLFKSKEIREASMPSYEKWYTKDIEEKLLSVLRIDYACIFMLTIFTGFRISSVLALRVDSIDLKNMRVNETISKTGKIHSVIIPSELCRFLTTYITEVRSQYKSNSSVLFINKAGMPITYNACDKAFKRAAKKAGITEKIHTHAGRATFLAALRSKQINDKRENRDTFSDADICQLMDWSSMACLENYDMNRIQEISPLIKEVQEEIYNLET